jgi:uncharacterized protein YdiU (UPF0061 family)
MLPLFHDDEEKTVEIANDLIPKFEERFKHHWLAGMRAKLGLFTEEAEDAVLIEDLLTQMKESGADFTNTFAALSTGSSEQDAWQSRWQTRLAKQPQSRGEVEQLMRRSNPAFIPRNHKVEEALAAATGGDLKPLHALLAVITRPWDHDQKLPEYSNPGSHAGYKTFCGT